MGIMKIGSSSSYDTKLNQVDCYEELVNQQEIKKSKNPDPYNYNIIKYIEVKNNIVVKVKYPDCTNYEGMKIMVYKNCTIEQLKLQKTIDPHFSNNKKFHSPFARFEPTKNGWDIAIYIATII